MQAKGAMNCLKTDYDEVSRKVNYSLSLDQGEEIDLNACVGQRVSIQFLGEMTCVGCGRLINKTFRGGYCFPCTQSLAECDICMVRPEKCHHTQGTCRDNNFAQEHCFQPHTLYIARSDVIKIGITRQKRQMTRWMEQGAMEACVIGILPTRKDVGLAEKAIAEILSDRANWRRMLKGEVNLDPLDFYGIQARKQVPKDLQKHLIENGDSYCFKYPVQRYPEKVKSLKLDKDSLIEGDLTGIKGQYLMFGDNVVNMRSHAGYHVEFTVG